MAQRIFAQEDGIVLLVRWPLLQIIHLGDKHASHNGRRDTVGCASDS